MHLRRLKIQKFSCPVEGNTLSIRSPSPGDFFPYFHINKKTLCIYYQTNAKKYFFQKNFPLLGQQGSGLAPPPLPAHRTLKSCHKIKNCHKNSYPPLKKILCETLVQGLDIIHKRASCYPSHDCYNLPILYVSMHNNFC